MKQDPKILTEYGSSPKQIMDIAEKVKPTE